jgi:hypothetical protein
MWSSIRRRFSYANVVATLALVFAMAGSAVAAKHYLINSTRQINPKVLKKLKGSTGKTGAAGPAGLAGLTGKEGPQGKQGAPGTNGATNVVVRTAQVTVEDGKSGAVTATCEPGERATGGGVETGTGNFKNVWSPIPGGKPVPAEAGVTPTGWRGDWLNESGVTDTFHVYAVCASP